MEYFPPALENLVEHFAKLPGIGRKTAQRLAFYVLSLPQEEADAFAQSITQAKTAIHCCPVCQNLTEGEGPCAVCASPKRDHGVICVVADPKDVVAMERSREYHGHQPGHGGGGHRHVSGPAAQALPGAGLPPGLWHPRGQPPGICRRRHPHARPGGTAGDVSRNRTARQPTYSIGTQVSGHRVKIEY